MKNNMNITLILAAVIIAGGAFFGGMQYQKSQRPAFGAGQGPGGRQFAQGRANGGVRPVNGEILSQDDKSITVKMQDGSSKIVILSDKTTINKATTGLKSDLKTGERISAFGTTNSDGSMTAQTISIGGNMFGRGPSQLSITPAK